MHFKLGALRLGHGPDRRRSRTGEEQAYAYFEIDSPYIRLTIFPEAIIMLLKRFN
jgi:hypothetical protein